MDKNRLYHISARLRAVNAKYLAVALIVSTVVGVMALRANNTHMADLREAVYASDKSGNDVEGALRRLREYVYGHMNTGLSVGDGVYPPIQLKYTYERLLQAERKRVADANGNLYTEAQAYCEQQNPDGFSGRTRVPCIEQYVLARTVKEQPVPSDMYKFDFVSPVWSPDLAGFSLLASGAFAILLAVRIIGVAVLKRLTR